MSFICHNKPTSMYFMCPKGFFDLSSYKREKGWPKCTPDPWTHCSFTCLMWLQAMCNILHNMIDINASLCNILYNLYSIIVGMAVNMAPVPQK